MKHFLFLFSLLIPLATTAQKAQVENPVFISQNRVVLGSDTVDLTSLKGEKKELLLSQRNQQADLLFATAMENYAKGNFREAVTWLDSTLYVHPEYAKAYTNRGYIKAYKNALLPAFRDFNKALEIDSTLANAWFGRARAQDRAGRTDEAVRDYGKTLEFDKKYIQAYYFRSLIWQDKGESDKALSDLNDLLEQDSTFIPARNDRALLLAEKGETERAVADLDWILRKDSLLVYSRFNRAKLYLDLEKTEEALADVETAIKQKNDLAEAWQLMGNIYFGKSEFEKAREAFNKALEKGGTEEIYISRAACNLKLQAYKEAVDDCNKLLANGKDSAIGYLNRGIARQMLNDPKGACEDWTKAKALGIKAAEDYLLEDCQGE